jgi:hypothetical protein
MLQAMNGSAVAGTKKTVYQRVFTLTGGKRLAESPHLDRGD